MSRMKVWAGLTIGSLLYHGVFKGTWMVAADAAYWSGCALFTHWLCAAIETDPTVTEEKR